MRDAVADREVRDRSPRLRRRGSERRTARRTGRRVGLKVAGGVKNTKIALTYLVIVNETLGQGWLTPDLFRIGASSLLDDLLMQLEKEQTGSYAGPDYFPKD